MIRSVHDFEKSSDPIGEIERIQDGNHSSCDGFMNILSFGVLETSGDIQSIRTAVAWLVRSATEESDTAYGAEDFEKGSARGTKSQLRYKLPNRWDYIIIGISLVTIITQFYFVGFHPSAFLAVSTQQQYIVVAFCRNILLDVQLGIGNSDLVRKMRPRILR